MSKKVEYTITKCCECAFLGAKCNHWYCNHPDNKNKFLVCNVYMDIDESCPLEEVDQMSKVNFLADYLGNMQTYLDIVKEDYTETLLEITIDSVEKEKIVFRAKVNVNNPNYQEVVDEFREDIAGFLDKYIDEDTVTPEMMYVTIIPKNILG